MDYKIILYIIFGMLPSLFWLFYYLRKDIHPEPKKMIIKMFLWGAAITIPVFFIQLGMSALLDMANFSFLATSLIYWFLVISLTEEIFKFLIVRLKAVNSPNLDEPTDLVIYMIIAALGFAAVENMLYLFIPVSGVSFNTIVNRTLIITLIRFIGATFLHTLCSGFIGYVLALAYCEEKNRLFKMSFGITSAVLLHGFYNFSIIALEGYPRLLVPAAIIIFLAVFVISGFNRLRQMKSVCKINNKNLKIKNG